MQTVIETSAFIADARAARLTDEEREAMILKIASDPLCGVEIPGTGGARKIRFAGRGKGKSGGYRVITFFGGVDIPLFALNIFAKSDQADLTQADRNEMRKELAGLVKDYKTGVLKNVKSR